MYPVSGCITWPYDKLESLELPDVIQRLRGIGIQGVPPSFRLPTPLRQIFDYILYYLFGMTLRTARFYRHFLEDRTGYYQRLVNDRTARVNFELAKPTSQQLDNESAESARTYAGLLESVLGNSNMNTDYEDVRTNFLFIVADMIRSGCWKGNRLKRIGYSRDGIHETRLASLRARAVASGVFLYLPNTEC